MRHLSVLLVVVSLAAGALNAHASDRILTLTFTPSTVVVSGDAPSHEIVLIAIGIDRFGRSPLLTREVLTQSDSDADGVVTFTPRKVPERSLWVAVDVQDGAYGVASPVNELPATLALAASVWEAQRTVVTVARPYVEVLLVRPGSGSWALHGAEGGSHDADGRRDGLLTLRLDTLEGVTIESAGPAAALAGDLLVVIDPDTLQYFIGEAP